MTYMRHISALVSFLIIVAGCGSVASDETKANHRVEIWREYSFDENETEFDTTLVKGTITKKVQYNGDAGIMSSTKFSVSPETIKKVTIYDDNGNLKTVETYYGKSDTNGIIEENYNDSRGNPIKKLVSNIEAGKRTISIEFDIVNEYSLNGNLVKVTLIPGDDTLKASVTKNSYNEDGKVLHSISTDRSGNIISEVKNAYNKSGDLINHWLYVTDMNKIKRNRY